MPAHVTSASCSGRNLFLGNWPPKPVVNSAFSPAWHGVRQVLPRGHGFEQSSLFQYSNGSDLFHLLLLPPYSFNRSNRAPNRGSHRSGAGHIVVSLIPIALGAALWMLKVPGAMARSYESIKG
jgi:hypothetical protein